MDALDHAVECGSELYRYRFSKPTWGYLYFLTKDSEIVYIGVTLHLHDRMRSHAKNFKGMFDDVLYVTVRRTFMTTVEADLIAKIRPPLNVRVSAPPPPSAVRRGNNA